MSNDRQDNRDEKQYEVTEYDYDIRGNQKKAYVKDLSSGDAERIFGSIPREQRDGKTVFRVRKDVVMATICNEHGVRLYQNVKEADALSNMEINKLFDISSKHNGLGKDAEEAEGKD